MRNFIIFIVAIGMVGLAGYVGYRMYHGESVKDVATSLASSEQEEKPDRFKDAREAYRDEDYEIALKRFKEVVWAHDSGEKGGRITDDQRQRTLIYMGHCYMKLWERGGGKDASLKANAIRAFNRFIDEYPDSSSRYRVQKTLRKLTSEPKEPLDTEGEDEGPPQSDKNTMGNFFDAPGGFACMVSTCHYRP